MNPVLTSIRTVLAELQNVTTKTQAEDLSTSLVIELGERDLVLSIPKNSCAQGHTLLVTLVFQEGGAPENDVRFSATCTVNAIEEVDLSHDCVSVRLLQYGK